MSRTVNTGWRNVTPGACVICGFDDRWDVDGRGTVYCADCDACESCGSHDGHWADCRAGAIFGPDESPQSSDVIGTDEDPLESDA